MTNPSTIEYVRLLYAKFGMDVYQISDRTGIAVPVIEMIVSGTQREKEK